MLHFVGNEGTSEWLVANRVRHVLAELWPEILIDEADNAVVMSNCKIYGYEVQDLDVVICLNFPKRRVFQPTRPVRCQQENEIARRDIVVRSLAVVIEVKGHDQRGVRFDGDSAKVLYTKNGKAGWHDATEQSVKQAHALKGYLTDFVQEPVYVTNLIYFENLEESDLPRRPHNCLAGRMSGRALLTAIADVARPWVRHGDGQAQLSGGKETAMARALFAPAFQVLKPSTLDRRRMEKISKRQGFDEDWLKGLGTRQTILRGRGGTGKTIALLQLAHQAYEERGARTLLLTYNLALVADMRRVLSLMNMPSGTEDGGIRIESVMSFVGKVLNAFGAIDSERDFLEQYPDACLGLAENITQGDIPQAEITKLLSHSADKFEYDYVMVDEGQDWPKVEIQILRACFPDSSFVVADGIDQLIRGSRAAWTQGIPSQMQAIHPLKVSLRMKKNLAMFNNGLAIALGVDDWKVEPSDEIRGGRVIILNRGFSDFKDLQARLVAEAKDTGNSLVDMLYCVSSSWASNRGSDEPGKVHGVLGDEYIKIWDGTRVDVRKDFPRDVNQIRLFQFDSCRGLEGWTVVCLGLGEFLQQQYDRSIRHPNNTDAQMQGDDQVALEAAARWAMIASTRAIDTLVIEGAWQYAPLLSALQKVSLQLPDVVEWL